MAPPDTLHVVRFEPAGATVQCAADANLLDAALAAGFFPRHSCRRGECRECEATVLSGEVSYAEGRAPEGLAAGRCLTCLARPAGDVVLEAPEVSATPGRRIVQVGARVVAIERVSEDVTVLRLQTPAGTGFDFEAGQYVDILLRDGTRRSYSMANAPDGSGQLELHVRAMPGGRFSQHAYRSLKPRDLLRIEGPFGAFKLTTTDAPVILLASGTGYAPIASMMLTHHEQLAQRGAALYWGGRRRQDLYAFEEALAWAVATPGARFVPVLSEPDPGWTGRTGYVHEAVMDDHADLSFHEVFACGNPAMVDAARHGLPAHRGLAPGNFRCDAFVTAGSTQPVHRAA